MINRLTALTNRTKQSQVNRKGFLNAGIIFILVGVIATFYLMQFIPLPVEEVVAQSPFAPVATPVIEQGQAVANQESGATWGLVAVIVLLVAFFRR